jgi:hypothetical protein
LYDDRRTALVRWSSYFRSKEHAMNTSQAAPPPKQPPFKRIVVFGDLRAS